MVAANRGPHCTCDLRCSCNSTLAELEEQMDKLQPYRFEQQVMESTNAGKQVLTAGILAVCSVVLAVCSVLYLSSWKAVVSFCLAWLFTFLAGLVVGLALTE